MNCRVFPIDNSSVKEEPPSRTIISIDETPAGQRFYWGEQEIDISQISTAVKRIGMESVFTGTSSGNSFCCSGCP